MIQLVNSVSYRIPSIGEMPQVAPNQRSCVEEAEKSHLQSPLRLFATLAARRSITRVYVGELHEKWQFPSDHLPVGAQVDDFRVVSWNVLNSAYMSWVLDKDSQGLKGSQISDLHIPIKPDGFTMRDAKVIEMIRSMIDSSNGMIALQECSQPFLSELERALPPSWSLIKKTESAVKDQEIVLFNNSLFTYRPDLALDLTGFDKILHAAFEKDGKIYRLINNHMPGEPQSPARYDFAALVAKQLRDDEVMIALGDHNFDRDEMLEAYQKAGLSEDDFTFHTPWNSNIDPNSKESKAIDHIFIKGAASRDLEADEIFAPHFLLQETIDLLSDQPIHA